MNKKEFKMLILEIIISELLAFIFSNLATYFYYTHGRFSLCMNISLLSTFLFMLLPLIIEIFRWYRALI